MLVTRRRAHPGSAQSAKLTAVGATARRELGGVGRAARVRICAQLSRRSGPAAARCGAWPLHDELHCPALNFPRAAGSLPSVLSLRRLPTFPPPFYHLLCTFAPSPHPDISLSHAPTCLFCPCFRKHSFPLRRVCADASVLCVGPRDRSCGREADRDHRRGQHDGRRDDGFPARGSQREHRGHGAVQL